MIAVASLPFCTPWLRSISDLVAIELATPTQSRSQPTPILTYSSTFKDHLAHPRNAGELSDANAIAEETNPICGDRMRLALSVRDARIEEVKFLAYGCPPTLVCGSVLTELIQGKQIAQALALTKADLLNAIGGLPARKHHSAALAIETLRAALKIIESLSSSAVKTQQS